VVGDLELELSDAGEDRLLVADVGAAQDVDHALLVELRQPLAELLVPARVGVADGRDDKPAASFRGK
jgi:hypothetical protein